MATVQPTTRADIEEAVLAIVRDVAQDIHPGRPMRCTLDSPLENELGLDSVGRVELAVRLEQQLGTTLGERAVLTAECARDLVTAVLEGHPTRARPLLPSRAPPEAIEGEPSKARTLIEALSWHAERHGERVHAWIGDGDNPPRGVTYGDLARGAERVAGALRERDVGNGESVAIMLPTGQAFLQTFLGVLLAGGVPVPIYPPFRASQLEEHLRRHETILENARATTLVTWPEALGAARLLRARVPGLRAIEAASTLVATGRPGPHPTASGLDVAFLQYTSGSTGDPKGVVLTHANLLANVRAMGAAIGASATDVFVSWLPLYHDMGLIGAWLGSLYYGMPLVLLPPTDFLTRPSRWLRAIHTHRGTLSAAPNFAYELCARRIPDAELEGLDLSSWRMAANGAEPVAAATIDRFVARFGGHGFRRDALTPVYGLAESCVGLAFTPVGRGPRIERIDKRELETLGRATPATELTTDAVSVVSSGRPLPDHEIRVVDAAGRELGEREEGLIEFRGPSATRGYFQNDQASAALHDGVWLRTGDRGYLTLGELCVTGRTKDVIIRAGRDVFPYEIEGAVGEMPGIRRGNVAVFAATDPNAGTERLVVLAETREDDDAKRETLRQQIDEIVVQLLGAPADDVVLAAPHTVLKTSSGKIRRSACRAAYESGEIVRERPAWRKGLALALATVKPVMVRARREVVADAYAARCYAVFGLGVVPSLLAAMLAPNVNEARETLKTVCRGLLRGAGAPVTLAGETDMPHGPVIVVCNHASYLDAIVLTAALPPRFGMVAKRELLSRAVVGDALRAIGTEGVERFDAIETAQDRVRLEGVVRAGRSLVFFPEGTIVRGAGLQAFHLGAFRIAAETGTPIVPVAIRGSRSMLRPDQWFPRPSKLEITIGKAVVPQASGWSEAVRLRDEARTAILAACGEPDLGQGRDFARP